MGSKKTKLVLIFGGESAEHEISCITATHIYNNVDKDKFDVELIAITQKGKFVKPFINAEQLDAEGEPINLFDVIPTDSDAVVFPVLHGPLGEDGTLQGLLEILDVAYVGAGVLASSTIMDKATSKILMDSHGIPQAKWLSFREEEYVENKGTIISDCISKLGTPCFVKPSNMGSSIGISKANNEQELHDAIDLALKFDEVIVVEEAIDGREIEFAILGNLEPTISGAGEILAAAEFYDYQDKYFDNNSTSVIPAEISKEHSDAMKAIALDAYKKIGLEGMSRADFLLEENGRGPLLNEFNTIPGFTPISMYPKLIEHSGIEYSELITRLVEFALERHARRAIKRTAKP